MPAYDELPSWIAHAVVRAAALEGPTEADLHATVQAWVELAAVRLLCEVARDLDHLPFTVESAMRLSMGQPMDLEAWLDLYAALDHTGAAAELGLPEPLPASVTTAYAALGGTGPVTVMRFLQQVDEQRPLPELVAAAADLAGHTSWRGAPLTYVLRVEPSEDGTRFEVDARPLCGTGYPSVRRSTHRSRPPVKAGRLCFWDGDAQASLVPRWVARWHEPARELRLWAGRDPTTGHGLYLSRQGDGGVQRVGAIPHDLPPFLGEPSWTTPDPADHTDPRAGSQNADTAAFVRRDAGLAATQRMAERRTEPPAPQPARTQEDAPAGARMILRVQAGPDLLRYVPVEPGHDVVAGRNQGFSTFVLHHHQISRSHTRVRIDDAGVVYVQDLKSTNGTHLNGRPVPTDQEAQAVAGDVVHVGPVPCRLEWATPEREARLDAVHALRDDEVRRDPLTRLLRPSSLADELPEALQASFRDGGAEGDGVPSLWGVLLYIDRLTAMHAQHGERVADRVFRSVARVLQSSVPEPGRWIRVGYGELLYPLVGVDEAGARADAERLVLALQDHPWPDPIREVTLTGAVQSKPAADSAQVWLQRLRRTLQQGRSQHGRGRVYPTP